MALQPTEKLQPRSSSNASTKTALRTDPVDQRACTSTVETGFCTDATKNVPRDSTGSIPRMDPAIARKHFDRIGRFRVLVIGRSNAGKTTLLQRICNTTELPEVFNSEGKKIDPNVVQGSLERGEHSIENELIFRSNTRFIFHDSRGFEAGSEEEVKLLKNFLIDHAAITKLEKRIHAIWYCIPLTDSERPIVAAEELFFNECNTGNVPVIVVLTKADAMELEAIGQLRDQGLTMKEARPQAGELAKQLVTEVKARIEEQLARCKYHHNDCLALFGMNEANADCDPLLRCTTNALDDIELQHLVISAQQVNFNLNIEYAIKYIMKKADGPFDKKALELGILDWMPYLESSFKKKVVGPRDWELVWSVWDEFSKRWTWSQQKWSESDSERKEKEARSWRSWERRQKRRKEEEDEGSEEEEQSERDESDESEAERDEEELRARYEFLSTQDTNLNGILFIDGFEIPVLCPSHMESSVQQWIIHGAGCILIFEYSYFYLQAKADQKNIISLAVKEYQESSIQSTVVVALQHAIQEHNKDHMKLQQAIFDIIVENRMSNKFNLAQQSANQA